jgi:glycosyltransferase involved in cell wall biosynthesis
MNKYYKSRTSRFLISKYKKNPLFSIITVVKNNQNLILKTIKSIEHLKFKNFEYIIVDGNSEDSTLDYALTKKKKINYLISEKDNGIYDAMNKGIKIANGCIIVFVNAGDTLTKNSLTIISKIFKKKKEIDFVFGSVKRHYTKQTIHKYGFNAKRLRYNFDFATAHSTGFFMKKKSINKVGLYNTNYKCSSDYDYYYRTIIKKNMLGASTRKSQLIGIVSSGGYSSKVSFINHLLEECKIRLNNGQNIFLIIFLFFNTIIKNFIKFFYYRTL